MTNKELMLRELKEESLARELVLAHDETDSESSQKAMNGVLLNRLNEVKEELGSEDQTD